jgi:predicted neuraminidase
MKNGRLVLVYNPSHTQRFPLMIATSVDGGKTWENKCILEEASGEFPAAILTSDGVLHITYTYALASGQRAIKHVAVSPDKLF